MGSVQVGAKDPILSDLEQALATDGSHVLQAELATALPWTAIPVVSTFVGLICNWVSSFIVTNLDKAGFAIYTAVKTNKQVSNYIAIQEKGPSSGSDSAGDSLIHLGD